jgi:hypothetical protein
MKLSLVKKAGWIVATAVTLFTAYSSVLNARGYCFERKKYLSSDEMMGVAIQDLLQRYPPSIELRKHHPDAVIFGYLPPDRPIRYDGIRDFLLKNPGCCKLVKELTIDDRHPNNIEQWTGVIFGYAVISYQVNYIDEEGLLKSASHIENIPISNCGKPQRWRDSVNTSRLYVLYRFINGETK